ncbi:hypothetical protein [Herpetosiphon sp.]|nr:hypothetical protein [Herpetosiphon sp.]
MVLRKWISLLLIVVALTGGVSSINLNHRETPTDCDPTGCGGG